MEFLPGVYMKKNGSLLALMKPSESEDMKYDFIIDSGMSKPHPFLRARVHYVERMTGLYFVEQRLKGCEYLGELGEDEPPKVKPETDDIESFDNSCV